MRIKPKRSSSDDNGAGDLTPMIDMTFQLIAFFMVLINLEQTEQHQEIELPESVLAKPPEGEIMEPLTIHMTEKGTVIIKGIRVKIENARGVLDTEASALHAVGKSPSQATVIIRGHRDAPAGNVQELIQFCQEAGYEKFALRAKEKIGRRR